MRISYDDFCKNPCFVGDKFYRFGSDAFEVLRVVSDGADRVALYRTPRKQGDETSLFVARVYTAEVLNKPRMTRYADQWIHSEYFGKGSTEVSQNYQFSSGLNDLLHQFDARLEPDLPLLYRKAARIPEVDLIDFYLTYSEEKRRKMKELSDRAAALEQGERLFQVPAVQDIDDIKVDRSVTDYVETKSSSDKNIVLTLFVSMDPEVLRFDGETLTVSIETLKFGFIDLQKEEVLPITFTPVSLNNRKQCLDQLTLAQRIGEIYAAYHPDTIVFWDTLNQKLIRFKSVVINEGAGKQFSLRIDFQGKRERFFCTEFLALLDHVSKD
jgi:hypothetical protein